MDDHSTAVNKINWTENYLITLQDVPKVLFASYQTHEIRVGNLNFVF